MHEALRKFNVDNIARVCHEANRAYCATLGDSTQLSWHNAPDWQKESAREGVVKIMNGEVKSPRESHESWLEKKRADGWSYGETKDVALKKHPCFKSYDELPIEQRRKDTLFFVIVNSMISEPV